MRLYRSFKIRLFCTLQFCFFFTSLNDYDALCGIYSKYFYNLQEKLLGHLGVVLYEYLGEEYPEVLGSILGAIKVSIVLGQYWLYIKRMEELL